MFRAILNSGKLRQPVPISLSILFYILARTVWAIAKELWPVGASAFLYDLPFESPVCFPAFYFSCHSLKYLLWKSGGEVRITAILAGKGFSRNQAIVSHPVFQQLQPAREIDEGRYALCLSK